MYCYCLLADQLFEHCIYLVNSCFPWWWYFLVQCFLRFFFFSFSFMSCRSVPRKRKLVLLLQSVLYKEWRKKMSFSGVTCTRLVTSSWLHLTIVCLFVKSWLLLILACGTDCTLYYSIIGCISFINLYLY